MLLLTVIILGMIEGVTEFLPISSTGHLIVAERLLGFHDVQDIFTVIVQLGAILAVIWYYRKDLWSKISGLFRRERTALQFWSLLIIATIPAGIFGLILDKKMDAITTTTVVGWSLFIGGIVLWLVDRKPVTLRRPPQPQIETITRKQSLLVGLAQCVAIIPGVSRSGSTIVGGLLSGLDRPTATAFSFYLSIPVMILASGLKLVKYHDSVGQLPGGLPYLIIAVICSFITALLSITWLLKYVSRHNFRPFAYYRIVAGLLILLFLR